MVRVIRINVPKPKYCLGLIDLQTATEVITIFTLINKVSGFYGILAVFTGAQISALQMSMYIWSIFGTIVCLWALKQIHNEKPMQVVSYAYFFVIDFFVNILYTVMFASIWFFIISDGNSSPPIGGDTFDSVKSAAGFVDPVLSDVAKVHIVATPDPNPLKGQHADLIGEAGPLEPNNNGFTFSAMSILFFWLIKVYCILIVFSYARSLVLRSHISPASFPVTSNFQCRVQKWMLSAGYWREEDEDFQKTSVRVN